MFLNKVCAVTILCVLFIACIECRVTKKREKVSEIPLSIVKRSDIGDIIFFEDMPKPRPRRPVIDHGPEELTNNFGIRVGNCPIGYVWRGICVPR